MQTLQPLQCCLEGLLAEHKKLLELAKTKKDSLLKGSIKVLASLLPQENQVISKIQTLENERQLLFDKVLKEANIEDKDLSMHEWILQLETPVRKDQLLQLRNELRAVMHELKRENEQNQQLLEQSREYVQFMLDSLADDQEEEFTYKNPLHQPAKGNRSFFDSKA